MIWLKIIIILVFSLIFLEDYKDRMVRWFWYPIIGVLGFLIQKQYIETQLVFLNATINLCIITTVLLILWVYSKLILKKKLINQSLGIGDVMFFVFIAFCFSVVSFLVLYVFSLIFSLALHIFFKNKDTKHQTIPLAGYMSLFFIFVYGVSFFINCNILFAY